VKLQKDTKTAILDLAQDLTQTHSLMGFSFQDLAKGVGIKKGSLYYHFETKDDLAIKMLERAEASLIETLSAVEHKSASSRFKIYINIFGKYFGASKKMCPGGSFASIWNTLSQPVQTAVRQLAETQIKILTQIVESGQSSGEFKQTDYSSREIAIWIASTLQGALLTARIMNSSSLFQLTLKQLEDSLKA